MGAVVVVVGDVIREQPSQMTLVENDDVIEQLPADAADPSFRDAVANGSTKMNFRYWEYVNAPERKRR